MTFTYYTLHVATLNDFKLGHNDSKILPISLSVEMNPQVNGHYKAGYRNSVVMMKALKIKK